MADITNTTSAITKNPDTDNITPTITHMRMMILRCL